MGRAQEKAESKKEEMSEEALGVGREVTLTRDVGLSRGRAIMLDPENGKTQRRAHPARTHAEVPVRD